MHEGKQDAAIHLHIHTDLFFFSCLFVFTGEYFVSFLAPRVLMEEQQGRRPRAARGAIRTMDRSRHNFTLAEAREALMSGIHRFMRGLTNLAKEICASATTTSCSRASTEVARIPWASLEATAACMDDAFELGVREVKTDICTTLGYACDVNRIHRKAFQLPGEKGVGEPGTMEGVTQPLRVLLQRIGILISHCRDAISDIKAFLNATTKNAYRINADVVGGREALDFANDFFLKVYFKTMIGVAMTVSKHHGTFKRCLEDASFGRNQARELSEMSREMDEDHLYDWRRKISDDRM